MKKVAPYLRKLSILIISLILLLIIYDFGFDQTHSTEALFHWIYLAGCITIGVFLLGRYTEKKQRPPINVRIFDVILGSVAVIVWLNQSGIIQNRILQQDWTLYLVLFLIFIRIVLVQNLTLKRSFINPAQLFLASFLLIILSGSLLLMMPKSTYNGISFLDALFTSTSAVCVTGLVVVDTGTSFTWIGQSILMLLIQAGGLGIMTFTSYFSYFFRGSSSFENQLLMKDMTNSEKIAEIYHALKKIILLTFCIEAAGAVAIYYSLGYHGLSGIGNPLFFSVFHSISGFCNAGFSSLPESLYTGVFRFNYLLQTIVALLFIIGGLGFPIVLNFVKYLKHLIINRFIPGITSKQVIHKPWVINLNARIVIITTLTLLVGGTALFYLFEYGNTLEEHHGFGKIITAFFSAATPRTAGFNAVDMASLKLSTLLLILFLMWIGASPGSTGGGIKTSTLAIAILNCISLARGKQRIELYHREISMISVRRAFAIISLSLMTIMLSVFLLSFFEQDKDLFSIVFECFSAFGTVGLSLGITGSLTDAGKFIIILTMFCGRVGMLTLLIAFFRKARYVTYRHPTEDILIN